MTTYYNEEYFLSIEKKFKASRNIYLFVLFATILACVGVWIAYMQLPYNYNDKIEMQKNIYLTINILLTTSFVVFSFIYLGIKHKRVKSYYNMLKDIKTGQKMQNESTFVQMDNSVVVKYNVDYKTMVVLEWSDKTQEYMYRNVLVDIEMESPNYKKGEIINYITHANVLIAHELKSISDVFSDI